MRALILPGTYDCKNLGDVAMLQVGVERLARLLPGSTIRVLTYEPQELQRFCPEATPASLRGWDRVREARILPRWRSHNAACPRPPGPGLLRMWLVKTALLRGRYLAGQTFLREFADTDAVLVAGCGLLNDHFQKSSLEVLALLEMALRRGVPVALFSQGVGPITHPTLRSRAADLLPRVRSIFIRDQDASSRLLGELGVSPERIAFTGDDAVALAWKARPAQIGTELGFNLRLSNYSGVTETTLAAVRDILTAKASRHGVSLLGTPIARGNLECDVRTAERLLEGLNIRGDAGRHADTPAKAIARIAQCRLVVTGSYHVAVFALAQGVSAVCIAANAYYEQKFRGLADAFGEGCAVVRADNSAFPAVLADVMDRLWKGADELRSPLLREAERQVQLAEQAYESLFRALQPAPARPRQKHALPLPV